MRAIRALHLGVSLSLASALGCSSSGSGDEGTATQGGAAGATSGGVPGASGGTSAGGGATSSGGAGGTAPGGSPGAGGSGGSVSGAGGSPSTGGDSGGAGESGGSPTGGAGAGTGGTDGGGTTGGGGTAAGGAPQGGSAGQAGGGAGGPSSMACAEDATGAHYVDFTAGDDNNDGESPDAAWKTLDRVNAETFQPGDAICFRAGESWTGELSPKGSGSEQAPIVIDQYGTGDRPHIAAGQGDLQPLSLVNLQYWEVNHLELTNDQGGPGDYRGIQVLGRDAGELSHIVIRDSYIHDVTGEVNWIGGDSGDNDPPWVTFQTGWDASKRTGGIVLEIESDNGTKTWFNDVVIENNVIRDTSFGGIIFKQLDGGRGWGVRNSANDSTFTPHTNLVIRNNFLSQAGTDYGCNTVYVTGSRGVVIEGNVTQRSGTSAIEVYNSDDVVIQTNETYDTVRKAGGADFNGIDADRASTNVVIQYNYVHDNGDGILLAQFAFGDSIIRYNLILNSSRMGINLHSDSSANNQTYNNLFYTTGSGALVNTSGNGEHLAATYGLRNNIFHSTSASATVVTGSGVTYASNLYSGVSAVGGDGSARTGNPMFVNAASIPDGDENGPAVAGLDGFKLMAGSPAIGNGVSIQDNGGFDFWQTPLYVDSPDIGPYEAP